MLIAWIAILSLFDIMATGVGISLGVIREGNPLLAWLFERSVFASCVLAAFVIGTALWLIATQIDRHRWIRSAMTAVLAVKLVVTGLHILWISLMILPG